MATDLTYGRDVRAMRDADDLWTEVTGVELVKQDAFHRITTNDVLGPGGDGWGKDVRELLGLPTDRLAAQQPVFTEVLQRDERIASADVQITPVISNGLADVRFEATCTTTTGQQFTIIRNVSDVTNDFLERDQAA